MVEDKIYIINLRRRKDRKKHCIEEFKKFPKFKIIFVDAFEETNPANGLWNTIVFIINEIDKLESNYIIICEDDHFFTPYFSFNKFKSSINKSKKYKPDIILGGVSSLTNAFKVSNDLYWIDSFSGTQFTIIFKRFYKKLINSSFSFPETADSKISILAQNKFVLFPFISIQKDFGYSDVTPANNSYERVDRLFQFSQEKLKSVEYIEKFHRQFQHSILELSSYKFEFPLYIIEKQEGSVDPLNFELKNKPEFSPIKLIANNKNYLKEIIKENKS